MRLQESLEIETGFCFLASDVPWVKNELANGLTRWPDHQVFERLTASLPGTVRQVQDLAEELKMCMEILRGATHLDELKR